MLLARFSRGCSEKPFSADTSPAGSLGDAQKSPLLLVLVQQSLLCRKPPRPSAAIFSVLCSMLPAFPRDPSHQGELQELWASLPLAKALLSVPNARASAPPSDFITAGAGKRSAFPARLGGTTWRGSCALCCADGQEHPSGKKGCSMGTWPGLNLGQSNAWLTCA